MRDVGYEGLCGAVEVATGRLRLCLVRAEAARVARDESVRAALEGGVVVSYLCLITGLTKGRIYQIRDERSG